MDNSYLIALARVYTKASRSHKDVLEFPESHLATVKATEDSHSADGGRLYLAAVQTEPDKRAQHTLAYKLYDSVGQHIRMLSRDA